MYTLLIVDDEQEIVEWLYELFTENCDLELDIYKAYSGKAALEYFQKIKIDVILSDIKMPGITGLQLMEKIKVNWPQCQFIFLTGYMNFEYVYKAIQNNGVRYLLKTEGDTKIMQGLKDALADIETNLKSEEIITKAKQQLNLALPTLQKEFFNELLDGYSIKTEMLEQRFKELHIKLEAHIPTLMIVGLFDNISINNFLAKKYETYYILKQIADECIPNHINKIMVEDKSYFMVWILQPCCDNLKTYDEILNATKNMSTYIRGSLEYIQYSCKNTLGMTISFAVKHEPFSLDSIYEKYVNLKKLLTYSINMSNEAIIFDNCFSSIDASEENKNNDYSKKIQYELRKIKILSNFFELRQRTEYFKLFDEITSTLGKYERENNNFNVQIYYNIAIIIMNFVNQYKLIKQIEYKIDLNNLINITEQDIGKNSIIYLRTVSAIIFDEMSNNELVPSNVVLQVKNYIDGHLKEDLALTKLSELVYFNPSYLSRLFKQVMGINITEYILNQRIEKAKEMLNQNTMRINEISIEVGYESSHSFARVFKSVLGISPQDYRLSVRNKRTI